MTDSRSFLFEGDYTKLGEPWVEDVGDLKQAKSSGKHLIFVFPTHAHLWNEKVINYDKRFLNMSNKPIKTQQCYIQYSVNCTDIFLPVCFVG